VAALVLDVETGDDPVGDDARPEAAGGGPGDLPVEEDLHPGGAAQVQLVPEDLLEELPAAERAVEHLGATHLHLEEGEPVAEAGGLVGGGQGQREPGNPAGEKGLDVRGAQTLADRLEDRRADTRLEAVVQGREADPAPRELAFGPLVAV